jgi:hypothetical protein
VRGHRKDGWFEEAEDRDKKFEVEDKVDTKKRSGSVCRQAPKEDDEG